ncbi:DUF481 domain-containing protein [Isoalcanivorax beigongshangi]|uniref:DUF481 domain-containing protein n=1 Tax=Isoalcanivorax beigongshangi TaxID=3238810 RepID=A0ABV4AM45_9GAMM
MRLHPFAAILLGLSLLSPPVMADTVWLRNGDILSGVVRLLDSGKVLLETDHSGTVSILVRTIQTMETSSPMIVRQQAWGGSYRVHLRPAEPGKVALVDEGEPFVVELSSLYRMMPERGTLEDWMWTGHLDLSFDLEQAESNIDDRDLTLVNNLRYDRWRQRFAAEYNRKTKDEKRTKDNYQLSYTVDYFLGERLFWQGQAQYLRDEVEAVSQRRTLGTGPGVQLWDNEVGALSLAALVNHDAYHFKEANPSESASLSVKWDYSRFLSAKTISLFNRGEVGLPLGGAVSEKLYVQLGLRFKVTSWATLNLKTEWDRVSGNAGDVNARRYTLGFGVAW